MLTFTKSHLLQFFLALFASSGLTTNLCEKREGGRRGREGSEGVGLASLEQNFSLSSCWMVAMASPMLDLSTSPNIACIIELLFVLWDGKNHETSLLFL